MRPTGKPRTPDCYSGMRHIPGGTFTMGSMHGYPDEAPTRQVKLDSFWIDEAPVTNRNFACFVEATGHVTTAEIAPDPKDYPGMMPELAHPGSLVFNKTKGPVPMNQAHHWWSFTLGTDWRHPWGPESDLEALSLWDHPVVHVSWHDVAAYAKWARKSLPTEAEHEYAARGGLECREFAWGDELAPSGQMMANYWQGHFPFANTREDGWERTSPVRSYPANGYGLFDMIGNVWEWTSDWWADQPARLHRKSSRDACCSVSNPRGGKGNVRIARIGQLGADPSTPAGISVRGYNDINALPTDAVGSYDVILSPQRPAGYTGAWWRLEPQTSELLLRLVAADWDKERDPTISIERLDAPATKPRVCAEVLQNRLAALPDAVDRMAILLVDHAATLVAEGYVNRMKVFDVSQIGGQLTGQFYYEGAYDLADDEALIVDAKVPDKCLYYSMILTNMIYETTDWYNNHSSLNDSQLHVDDDGMLRVVISSRDPGIANCLDTAGNSKGVIQGRWTECRAQPVPGARKVKIDQLMRALPANRPRVSTQEREQRVRDRRAALQQRNLW